MTTPEYKSLNLGGGVRILTNDAFHDHVFPFKDPRQVVDIENRMIIFKNDNDQIYCEGRRDTTWYACPDMSTLMDKNKLKGGIAGGEEEKWRLDQQNKCNIVDCFDGAFQCPGPNQILDSASRQYGIYENNMSSSTFLKSINSTVPAANLGGSHHLFLIGSQGQNDSFFFTSHHNYDLLIFSYLIKVAESQGVGPRVVIPRNSFLFNDPDPPPMLIKILTGLGVERDGAYRLSSTDLQNLITVTNLNYLWQETITEIENIIEHDGDTYISSDSTIKSQYEYTCNLMRRIVFTKVDVFFNRNRIVNWKIDGRGDEFPWFVSQSFCVYGGNSMKKKSNETQMMLRKGDSDGTTNQETYRGLNSLIETYTHPNSVSVIKAIFYSLLKFSGDTSHFVFGKIIQQIKAATTHHSQMLTKIAALKKTLNNKEERIPMVNHGSEIANIEINFYVQERPLSLRLLYDKIFWKDTGYVNTADCAIINVYPQVEFNKKYNEIANRTAATEWYNTHYLAITTNDEFKSRQQERVEENYKTAIKIYSNTRYLKLILEPYLEKDPDINKKQRDTDRINILKQLYDLIDQLWTIVSKIGNSGDADGRPMFNYDLSDSANPKKTIPEWANRLLRYLGNYKPSKSLNIMDAVVGLLLGRRAKAGTAARSAIWYGTRGQLNKLGNNVVSQLHNLSNFNIDDMPASETCKNLDNKSWVKVYKDMPIVLNIIEKLAFFKNDKEIIKRLFSVILNSLWRIQNLSYANNFHTGIRIILLYFTILTNNYDTNMLKEIVFRKPNQSAFTQFITNCKACTELYKEVDIYLETPDTTFDHLLAQSQFVANVKPLSKYDIKIQTKPLQEQRASFTYTILGQQFSHPPVAGQSDALDIVNCIKDADKKNLSVLLSGAEQAGAAAPVAMAMIRGGMFELKPYERQINRKETFKKKKVGLQRKLREQQTNKIRKAKKDKTEYLRRGLIPPGYIALIEGILFGQSVIKLKSCINDFMNLMSTSEVAAVLQQTPPTIDNIITIIDLYNDLSGGTGDTNILLELEQFQSTPVPVPVPAQTPFYNDIIAQLTAIKGFKLTQQAANVLSYLETNYSFLFHKNNYTDDSADMDNIIDNYNMVNEKFDHNQLDMLMRQLSHTHDQTMNVGYILAQEDSFIFAECLRMKAGRMVLRSNSLFGDTGLSVYGETVVNFIIDTINNLPNPGTTPKSILSNKSVLEILNSNNISLGGGAKSEGNIARNNIKNKQTRNKNTRKKNKYNKLTRKKIKNMKNKKLKKRQTRNKKKTTRKR